MGVGFISEEQRSGRLISGGKITSLATAFKLADGEPFTIYILPTTGTGTTEILTVKMPGNAAACPMPFMVEEWNPLLITEISADDILSTYDIYWASGDEANV
jgi:hypothetical protein